MITCSQPLDKAGRCRIKAIKSALKGSTMDWVHSLWTSSRSNNGSPPCPGNNQDTTTRPASGGKMLHVLLKACYEQTKTGHTKNKW